MTTPHAVIADNDAVNQSYINENFLRGCFFDEADEEYKKLEAERTAKMRQEIRDIDNFGWDCVDETYEGVTLKHAFDMNAQYSQVQYESECPTPFVEPHFREFCAKGHNEIDKLDPENGN